MAINNLTNTSTQQTSSAFDKCNNSKVSLLAGSLNSFLEKNPKRSYAAFINNSNYPITLILGDTSGAASVDKGIVLYSGGSFEITQINLYVGKVAAIASNACDLTYVECSFS